MARSPLTRSSYHADEDLQPLRGKAAKRPRSEPRASEAQ
jgi:hypothetical protein